MSSKVTSETVVSDTEALTYADELERVIGEIATGKRKPQNIPTEPMIALIAFARAKVVATTDQIGPG